MTNETPADLLTPNLRRFLTADPPRHTTIATVNPDGIPHQIVIWYELRGDLFVVNSRQGRRWPSNLRREGRASLAIFDGDDALTIACTLEDSYDGEAAQADIAASARRYYAPDVAENDIARYRAEPRISFVLRPVRINVHGDPR